MSLLNSLTHSLNLTQHLNHTYPFFFYGAQAKFYVRITCSDGLGIIRFVGEGKQTTNQPTKQTKK